jgi:hypothetical protein
MGQEERRNKAKLEKTQISLATSNTEYENAVKVLEETTVRWNREWKAAADKFQDLEEERLDFTKGSLWTFANIASTVCVSDDASCEKIRLSLERMDVEKDIATFIKERGTGQEIPDAPKYVNFCRGDVNDNQSEASDDDSYSVAQFPRNINPAFRTSSPQPSTFESHHDPNSVLAHDLGHHDGMTLETRERTLPPQKLPPPIERQRLPPADSYQVAQLGHHQPDLSQHGPFAAVPHDPYPLDGMTMLCRTGPPSDLSSQPQSARPSSRDSQSDYSNPTSMESQELRSGKSSPIKQQVQEMAPPAAEKRVLKKKSGFFQNHSPFRRKSTKDPQPLASNRNTWHASHSQETPARRPQLYSNEPPNLLGDRTNSPDPIDANASLALNVGENVFPVTTPDMERRGAVADGRAQDQEETDPIALALAKLKVVGTEKQSLDRISADRYHGISTPAPGTLPLNMSVAAGLRGTPPPSYDQPIQRLGVPPQAHTKKSMQETSQKFVEGTRSLFSPGNRPGSGYGGAPGSRPGTRGNDMPRAASPAPPRSASPRPGMIDDPRRGYRSASPNPHSGSQRAPSHMNAAPKRGSDQGYYRQNSPHNIQRAVSPAPYRDYGRPSSSHVPNDMPAQLVQGGDDRFGSQRGRSAGRPGTSSGSRAMGLYEPGGPIQGPSRQRSKSVADPSRQYTREGRPVLHYGKLIFSR